VIVVSTPPLSSHPRPCDSLHTERLELVPITLAMVEAVFRADRNEMERLARASIPVEWPGTTLIERAFTASLDRIRADAEKRLWGDRLMIIDGGSERRVVGSVIFHGRPDDDGIAEVGYGVEASSQGLGFATEGARAAVQWALEEECVIAVNATTPPWHSASIRVLEKIGMTRTGMRDHEILGDLLVFEIRK
jgi:ribosomal-protein-alanine N-acetyltransferase